MLVKDYRLPPYSSAEIRVGSSAQVFAENLADYSPSKPPPVLLVWRDGLRDTLVDEAMRTPNWPLRILAELSNDSGWNWEVKRAGVDEPIREWSEVLRLAAAAAGVQGAPTGNVTITLPLRAYDERNTETGGYLWWFERRIKQPFLDPFVDALLGKIISMLKQVRDAGPDFYVEQISMIIGKDPKDKISTLTPTLHSDTFYGFRETALCSLTEPGVSKFGGTLFVPTMKMSALESERPIEMEKLFRLVTSEPIVEARSGDVLMYDGMIGIDGQTLMANGVPHISPDLPGQSSRFLILMRNMRPPMIREATDGVSSLAAS